MKLPQRKNHKSMGIDELVQKAYKEAGVKTLTQDEQIKNYLKASEKRTMVRPVTK